MSDRTDGPTTSLKAAQSKTTSMFKMLEVHANTILKFLHCHHLCHKAVLQSDIFVYLCLSMHLAAAAAVFNTAAAAPGHLKEACHKISAKIIVYGKTEGNVKI